MRRHFLFGLSLFFLSSTSAFAECEAGYSAEKLGNDISVMSNALRAAQPALFQQAGDSLTKGVPCVTDPMAPIILASVYRYAGLQAFFTGREKEARAWFRSALELDSTFDWDVAEIPIDDPIRPIFDAERETASTEKVAIGDGVVLNIPDGIRITVDGRPLMKPALTLDRPHLVQSISKADNTVVQVWLIEGNALPEELLARTTSVPMAAAGPGGQGVAVQSVERARPPMKTPALIAGGALMAAGVGLYAASFASKGKFESATTLTEAKQYRATTNAMVIGAGGALAAGAGLTYVGFMLDGRPGIHWRSRF